MPTTDPSAYGGAGGGPTDANGAQQHLGFNVKILFKLVNDATVSAQAKLQEIKGRKSAVSIGDMFEMQMLMNHLSQLSEMSTAVVSAANTAISSMSRNIKQ